MRKLYISNCHNPYFNLAFEEYLVNNANENDEIYYLWQNDQTVVIGRNQNPWKECNIQRLDQDGGKLARRLSGGGAVFHDLGNLNFTIIRSEKKNSVNDNVNLIIDALDKLGVKAHFSGKNDILVDEFKVSGNAFVINKNVLCHHGTLLVDADLTRLADYLRPSKLKLQSKGIDSVISRVRNLRDFNGDIHLNQVIYSLVEAFGFFINDAEIVNNDNFTIINDDVKNYASWEWNFGSSPKFDIAFNERFEFGEMEISLIIKDGLIKDCNVFTDANDATLPSQIKENIIGTEFKKEELIYNLEFLQEEIKNPIISWVHSWDI